VPAQPERFQRDPRRQPVSQLLQNLQALDVLEQVGRRLGQVEAVFA
jgi:hypothetical protein